MKISSIAAVSFLAVAATNSADARAQAAADPLGEWRVADGTATVRIRKCGTGLFCGFVASAANPGKDFRNPDPTKRNRSTLGMEIFFDLKPTGDKSFTGETYNSDDGQIYIATLTPNGDTMTIKGCVPNGGACGSETWTLVHK
jgi:uncharacterized protein (DUF2147 family)